MEKADRIYIQATENTQSLETRERELRPLRMLADNHEKIALENINSLMPLRF